MKFTARKRSKLEQQLDKLLELADDIPAWIPNALWDVDPTTNQLATRREVDYAWADYGVAVEVQGGMFKRGTSKEYDGIVEGKPVHIIERQRGGAHNHPASIDADFRKLNAIQALEAPCGERWVLLMFSGKMIEQDTQYCIDMIRTHLQLRGLPTLEESDADVEREINGSDTAIERVRAIITSSD